MHVTVSIYNAYSCIYIQWYIAFQGDFPMFVHLRILVTCRRQRDRVRIEKTVCTFWICANSVHTWLRHGIDLYIPCIQWYSVICSDNLIYFMHICFFHFWLQDWLCCTWSMYAGMIKHQHTALQQERNDRSLAVWKHEIYHDVHGIYRYIPVWTE